MRSFFNLTRSFTKRSGYPRKALLVSCVSLLSASFTLGVAAASQGDVKPLNTNELLRRLKKGLDKFRNGEVYRQAESLDLSVTQSNGQTVTIKSNQPVNTAMLLPIWMRIIGPIGSQSTYIRNNSSTTKLQSADKSCNISIENDGEILKLTVSKRPGFSETDADVIISGFEVGATSQLPVVPGGQSIGPWTNTFPRTGSNFFDDDDDDHDDQGGRNHRDLLDQFDSFFKHALRKFEEIYPGQGQGLYGFSASPEFGEMLTPQQQRTRRPEDIGVDGRQVRGSNPAVAGRDPIGRVRSLGVLVFEKEGNEDLGWEALAGYDAVKEQIEDTIVNAVKYPEVYDSIAQKTRVRFESNRPKAVLLEGPPGTGKTLTARILASRCDRPLVHLKLESIVNKYYGESERKLAQIFAACDELESGAIIFIDEIDSLVTSRDSGGGGGDMHEATRRLLSVILQQLEGFAGKSKSLLLCATNRKQDLDSALLSRFDLCIRYDLPDAATRAAIIARYAKQFTEPPRGSSSSSSSGLFSSFYNNNKKVERGSLDGATDSTIEDPLMVMVDASAGLSCRDIKEACEQAERRWASRKIRERTKAVQSDGGVIDTSKFDAPPLDEYLHCIRGRKLLTIHSNVHPDSFQV